MIRRLLPAILASLAACGGDEAPPSDVGLDWPALAAAYVEDPAARRQALEDSLVTRENGYAALRLARYTEAGWGALPTWSPRVRPITAADLGQPPTAADADWARLDLSAALADDAELLALGALAFDRYPIQIVPELRRALSDAEAAEAVGLWRDGDQIGGLVWVETPGGIYPALTCATCHTGRGPEGDLSPGLPNHAFDYGRLLDEARGGATDAGGWGPGRVDVTDDGLYNPTVITDLRPIQYQRTLHRAATLWQDPQGLMVRIETLILTSQGQATRPPREIAAALARYLWALGEDLPPPPEATPGRAIFDRTCARCHAGEGLSGPGVDITLIGTPDAVAQSPARGTGRWRVPSLRGVGRRRPLLASGAIRDLDHLLDPARAAEVEGHRFGLTLGAEERAALKRFLQTL